MCGIYCCVSKGSQPRAPSPYLVGLLNRRGPDDAQTNTVAVQPYAQELVLCIFSTVLALRGAALVAQPCIDAQSKSALCWNGEAWKIGAGRVRGNDTSAILRLLSECSKPGEGIATAMNSVSGPFAFVYFDSKHSRLYFARDAFGRRSLLLKVEADSVTISSIADGGAGWQEVDADGIYMLELAGSSGEICAGYSRCFSLASVPDLKLYCFPYSILNETFRLNATILPGPDDLDTTAVSALEKYLTDSVAVRIPDNDNNCCCLSGSRAASGDDSSEPTTPIEALHCPESFSRKAPVAVLFSGGIDCTLLAKLISDSAPRCQEIDLLNVAFQNPRIHQSSENPYEQCPDRITARRSHEELSRVCPGRTWRLVEINVPYQETVIHRDLVLALMHPHRTEMDFSISLALYFASRGSGVVRDPITGVAERYQTPARVLFSGLGADELFGGYQRHATAFTRTGFKGLLEELELDLNRLGHRNLGRDDRILSHWGRETRYPYLDENLIRWAVKTPVQQKTGFREQHANVESDSRSYSPGKLILRQLASKLGLVNVAQEKKRAIQFGARTAKMDRGRIKGNHLIPVSSNAEKSV